MSKNTGAGQNFPLVITDIHNAFSLSGHIFETNQLFLVCIW
jgi:hypothetical protein